ncbi:MAG: hypothetical protein Q4E60_09790 [Bacteroidales bacterium]|nr:hypothetical protein [Bacteroidales bacterium]
MKNLYTIIAALAMAMGMASCSHEEAIEQIEAETPKAPVKVQAVTENAETRATYEVGTYRVLWSEGDKIKFVSKNDDSVVFYFTLSSEAGQPNGEFTMDADQADLADGEYMVYYPATWEGLTADGKIKSWPRQLFRYGVACDISDAPMVATATVSNGGTTVSSLSFTNVGAMVRYTAFSGEQTKYLYSVVLKAKRINGVDEDRPISVLNFDSRRIGARNIITFAVPPGNYEGVTLEYNVIDGSKAVKKAANMKIERNKFYDAKFLDMVYSEPVKAVDFGLGIKIADRNLGAASPEDFGDYYSFGETEVKTQYLIDDIRFPDCPQSSDLPLDHDAAYTAWGGNWHVPSDIEIGALLGSLNWNWTDNYNGTGVAGYILTSKVEGYEGNSVFLPQTLSSETDGSRESGLYWTATTPIERDHVNAEALRLSTLKTEKVIRSRGLPIRPVWRERE